MSAPLEFVRKTLGHEPRDPRLFELALTHASVGGESYERLEFLGDRVLGMVIARALYERRRALYERGGISKKDLESSQDNGSSCHSRTGAVVSIGSGASSNTACAFVPPMPKLLTPARRGVPLCAHGRSSVFT